MLKRVLERKIRFLDVKMLIEVTVHEIKLLDERNSISRIYRLKSLAENKGFKK